MRFVTIGSQALRPRCRTVVHRRRLGPAAAFVVVALSGLSLGTVDAHAAARPAAADPKVIRDWNAVAFDTIVVDGLKANAEAFMWFAFEQAAVYNAVVGITRQYELYEWNVRGPRGASPQAAAAVAAHDVLLEYFPGSMGRLNSALTTSLAAIPDGTQKTQGIRYGALAADRIIQLREDDGRFASVTFDMPIGPGVWGPTPNANAPFFDPWLAKLRPLLLDSPSQFRPGPPPDLTSAQYTADFIEVKAVGSLTSTVRSDDDTTTARFIAGSTLPLVTSSLTDLAVRHALDISDSARLFAAANMSAADAVIAAWDSKFEYGFWRPITAIRMADTDGNQATEKEDEWTPLLPTPAYPDYASGLCNIVGAVTRAVSGVLDLPGGRIDLNLTVGTAPARHYEYATDLNSVAIDARVWAGIHFRTADVVASEMGTHVGDWALDHYFQPTG